MNDEQKTAERLARIESNIEQIGTVLKGLVQDHEMRIRELERESGRIAGVLKLISWLGAPTVAAVAFFLSKMH